jgi:hypothetical protein
MGLIHKRTPFFTSRAYVHARLPDRITQTRSHIIIKCLKITVYTMKDTLHYKNPIHFTPIIKINYYFKLPFNKYKL